MSLFKTWTFNLNQKPIDNSSGANQTKSFFLQLITFLAANGWSYDGSSNGVSTNATTNISTVADIVHAAAGNAHSWQIMKSPEGFVAGDDGSYTGDQSRLWLLIATDSATATSWLVEGFTQKPTGGTITANPTNATYGLGFTNGQLILTPTSNMPIFHFAITSQGNFWAGITASTAGYMTTFIALYPTRNPVQYNGFDYPYATGLHVEYANASTNPAVPVTAKMKTWRPGGTVNTSSAGLALRNVADQAAPTSGSTGGFNRNGKVYTGKMFLGAYAGSTGIIAEVADFFVHTAADTSNKIVDDPTTPTLCNYGALLLPVNAIIVS